MTKIQETQSAKTVTTVRYELDEITVHEIVADYVRRSEGRRYQGPIEPGDVEFVCGGGAVRIDGAVVEIDVEQKGLSDERRPPRRLGDES